MKIFIEVKWNCFVVVVVVPLHLCGAQRTILIFSEKQCLSWAWEGNDDRSIHIIVFTCGL